MAGTTPRPNTEMTPRPTYDRTRDGNPFDWIIRQSARLRAIRQVELADESRERREREAQALEAKTGGVRG